MVVSLQQMVVDSPSMTYDLRSSFPTLQNAPITEAIIDVQVQLPPEVNLAHLRRFHEGLEKRFPRIDERRKVSATFQMDSRSVSEIRSSESTDGWLMRSENESLIVQARL